MAASAISNPTIPLGSVVLVTGANGLIASHVVDQLLAAGYRVRGTVRDLSRCSWLEPFFANRHGEGRLELVEVSDFAAAGAWDAAVKGVAGVAAVAGGDSLAAQDVDKSVEDAFSSIASLLEAAKAEPTVKSFVYTSSAWSAWMPDASKKVKLTEWSWNEDAVRIARSDVSPQEKGITPFMAIRTLLEQRIWDWIKREKPSYTFNAILPDTVIGEVLNPQEQGFPSTCGMVKWLWDGTHLDFLSQMQPQYHIDTHDTGLLYVAALVTPGVNGERLYGFGHRYSWPRVEQILSRLYPNKKLPGLKDNGWDQTEVPNQRAEELIRGLGGNGWTSLEDSVRDCAKGFA
ncbi:hypothetical protein F5X96DRAFT_151925 [Biscogniauxia mediterranea]|nr:hypothetical protein F5X96DRAFT_151925 [Biscogniauxia mediterranea]